MTESGSFPLTPEPAPAGTGGLRSPAWQHFRDRRKDPAHPDKKWAIVANCIHCGQAITSHNAATGVYLAHLRGHHPEIDVKPSQKPHNLNKKRKPRPGAPDQTRTWTYGRSDEEEGDSAEDYDPSVIRESRPRTRSRRGSDGDFMMEDGSPMPATVIPITMTPASLPSSEPGQWRITWIRESDFNELSKLQVAELAEQGFRTQLNAMQQYMMQWQAFAARHGLVPQGSLQTPPQSQVQDQGQAQGQSQSPAVAALVVDNTNSDLEQEIRDSIAMGLLPPEALEDFRRNQAAQQAAAAQQQMQAAPTEVPNPDVGQVPVHMTSGVQQMEVSGGAMDYMQVEAPQAVAGGVMPAPSNLAQQFGQQSEFDAIAPTMMSAPGYPGVPEPASVPIPGEDESKKRPRSESIGGDEDEPLSKFARLEGE